MKKLLLFIVLISFWGMKDGMGQWSYNGVHIYNTNSGNVGIGTNSPSSLLFVAKNMTEPTITVQNLGGIGGATYTMKDNVSGAYWKFKATNTGGFKIRDQASGLDVFVIEQNSISNLLYLKSGGNIGISTSTPANSALVDMNSTTKGFLPPRMTTAQRNTIASPSEGLVIYNTDEKALNLYDGLAWNSMIPIPAFACGLTISVNHVVSGGVAPVNKTVTYSTVTNIPGEPTKCWITQNLGADHPAAAIDDANEASAGWYWQFNRKQGYKHDGTARTPNTTWIDNIDEDLDWQASNDPCTLELGNGWRLPAYSEWFNVDASGNWTDWNGPWDSELKIHAAGYLWNSSGDLDTRGSTGNYNSSSQVDNTLGWILGFTDSECYVSQYNFKAFAISVRCIKE
jgi:hypothetical protein